MIYLAIISTFIINLRIIANVREIEDDKQFIKYLGWVIIEEGPIIVTIWSLYARIS